MAALRITTGGSIPSTLPAYGIQRVGTWAAAAIVETDTLFWNGPFYTVIDLVNWVRNNAEAMNDSLLRAGYGVTSGDRHNIDRLPSLIAKTVELATVAITARTWAPADVATEGTILAFLNDPNDTVLLAATWAANSVQSANLSGDAHYGVRIPVDVDVRNFEVRETNNADNSYLRIIQGANLVLTAQDSTYNYYVGSTSIGTRSTFALFYDEISSARTHYRGLIGDGSGYLLTSLTQAEYDALGTKSANTLYMVTA